MDESPAQPAALVVIFMLLVFVTTSVLVAKKERISPMPDDMIPIDASELLQL